MDFKARAQMWLDSPKVSDADKEIIRNSSDDKLRDMFGGDIAFGTAGLRGEMGPGTNRMNPLVVQKATVGMANFVIHHYGEEGKKRGVAVSFDSRHHSQDFASNRPSLRRNRRRLPKILDLPQGDAKSHPGAIFCNGDL